MGKMRPELCGYLIEEFSHENEIVYDPFAGSGTVLLEGWRRGHPVIGCDLNYYAYVISMGKMNPYFCVDKAREKIELYSKQVAKEKAVVNQPVFPEWVREFYHEDTLREVYTWSRLLREEKEWFLLANLMGILHHQRPGFLSFPASHGVPYLRDAKYPKSEYPDLYEYRDVHSRLVSKVERCLRHMPALDDGINRQVLYDDTSRSQIVKTDSCLIVTSPPYMKSLTYARDNRLRLWFLGIEDWKTLDKVISPNRQDFSTMITRCFKAWAEIQQPGDRCIMLLGDIPVDFSGTRGSLHGLVTSISSFAYTLVETYSDPIPEKRKIVKGNDSIKREVVMVLERKGR